VKKQKKKSKNEPISFRKKQALALTSTLNTMDLFEMHRSNNLAVQAQQAHREYSKAI
jgi:hypothetical protein